MSIFYEINTLAATFNWKPSLTTIDPSRERKFTVTQMDLFTVTPMQLVNNIPHNLKKKGVNIAIIDCIASISHNGFHIEHPTFHVARAKIL